MSKLRSGSYKDISTISEVTCTRCKLVKPLSKFHIIKSKWRDCSLKPVSHCKECVSEQAKKRYEKNKEKYNRNFRKRQLKKVYNLDYPQVEDMFSKQKGKCPICNRSISLSIKWGYVVDHNHVTGEVRGLLCSNCNKAIGLLNDDSITLNQAINYLYYNEETINNIPNSTTSTNYCTEIRYSGFTTNKCY